MTTVNVFKNNKLEYTPSIIISYVPKYLESVKGNYSNMSRYDAETCMALGHIFDECLVSSKGNDYTDQRDELLERYYLVGDYVFNDTTITINDNVAFEFKDVIEIEPNIYKVTIVVGDGCTKCAIERSPKLNSDVLKWLLRNMVKRLGMSTVTKSSVFEAYWLK